MKKNHLDIIDPIHDFIRATGPEQEIIDSPIFQRLRRIRQLSGAHLTYPGAQHTRFEHSLGVMHVAGQAACLLVEKGVLDSDATAKLRLAGLLHDIGHGPFSHLFEEVMREKSGITHEEMGKRIIEKTEIGDLISKSGLGKRSVSNLAFGDSKLQYMNEIISGALSADIMDYLLRDGYFTGAEHAKIDHKRIIQSLGVYKKKLALEKSALHSFESMMHSRYQMFKAVYFHKSVRSAEVMLLEAIRLADGELGLTSPDLDDYLKLTDEMVLSRLLALEPRTGELRLARGFARDYQNRNLLKCVYERILTNSSKLGEIRTGEIRAELSRRSKVDQGLIFVDSSVTPSIPLTPLKKESQSLVLISHTGGRMTGSEVPIAKIPLVSAMSGFMNILRIYTSSKMRKKVEIAAQSILGGLER